jgi:hypothetical protein
MRISSKFLAALSMSFVVAIAPLNAVGEDAVAVQYHFAGAADLSKDANFATATGILRAPSSAGFEDLVLDRLSRVFWTDLRFGASGKAVELLRPMLDDLLQAESVASFGANADDLSFVIATRLDKSRSDAWQKNLEMAMGGKGAAFAAENLSGSRWDNGFWIIQTPAWVVVGRGDGLASVRRDYLQQLQKSGRPWPALKDEWLQAVIDWPLLTAGNTSHVIPLKPARTTIDITASGGRFHITAYLSYPEAAPWSPQQWRIPKDLVREPLISFTAAQGVEPYLQLDDTLSRLATNPFTNQFYCWAQREMPFESYMAWPVNDASNVIKNLGTMGLGILNPILVARDQSRLTWMPANSQIQWLKSSLMAPFLRVAPGTDGGYLQAGLFLPRDGNPPVPADLWAQFESRSDIVYYNWELTGLRVHQWRLLCEIMSVLAPVSGRGSPPEAGKKSPPPFVAVENWLAGTELSLGNTVTAVMRTAPDELTVTRSAPMVFTGLELVWLSYWLADVPGAPLNMDLMPKAKVSGPGMPSH